MSRVVSQATQRSYLETEFLILYLTGSSSFKSCVVVITLLYFTCTPVVGEQFLTTSIILDKADKLTVQRFDKKNTHKWAE